MVCLFVYLRALGDDGGRALTEVRSIARNLSLRMMRRESVEGRMDENRIEHMTEKVSETR